MIRNGYLDECIPLDGHNNLIAEKCYTISFYISQYKILNYTLNYLTSKGIEYKVYSYYNLHDAYYNDHLITFTSDRSYRIEVNSKRYTKESTTLKVIV